MAVASVVAAPAERCLRVNPGPSPPPFSAPVIVVGQLLGGSFPGLGSVVQKFGLCGHAGQVHFWLPVSTVDYRR
jgi:hypothetical protein